ncbi:Cupredoxin superfamily protein [Salvia divinorum]|uniref:Cupredoxin superfamily protein n=1 Tax=Salvia divinorum TaxID=28513 RepID=A0ABD1GYY6_SALDI
MVLLGAAVAANHEVGGTYGWNAVSTVDYTNWATTNNFQVGDRLDFKYNQQFHNVMEVSQQDYESCNSSSPILTYTTGHDSIELTSAGHRYFICSTPGHCNAGQKLAIVVHCRHDDNESPPQPDHRSSSPSMFLNDLSLVHVLLCYIVWHELFI